MLNELATQCKDLTCNARPSHFKTAPKGAQCSRPGRANPLQVLCSPHPLYTSPKEPLPMMSSS